MSMIQKHCYECGTALIERELEGEGIVPYCPQCQQYRFPMYNVAVSMVVINEQTGQILLIRQYGKPHFLTSSLVRYFYLPHDGTYGFKGVSEDLTGDAG